MVFGNKQHCGNLTPNIFINNEKLDIVHSTTFLGLILDSKLSWKPQIGSITKKVAKVIGILTRAKQFLNKKTLIQLYFSFAYPYLIYGNIIWGSAPSSTLWPLFKIQKIIIRIICNIRKRNSTQNEFKNLKILRVPDIHRFSLCLFMFKYEKNLLPTCLNNLFRYNRDVHTHNTRNRNNLRQPKTHTNLAELFITNLGPKYWNNLDGHIDKSLSLACFKKNLIQKIIKEYG